MCNCIFCKIVEGKIPSFKLYEDSKVLVILDAFPSSKGHVLVIPKKHSKDIFDITDNEYSYLMGIVSSITKKLKKNLECNGFNVLQNNGEVAGQTVNHLHIHIIPRYENDNVSIKWETHELNKEYAKELIKDFKRSV